MKITKTANNNKRVTISKREWQAIGKKAGWDESLDQPPEDPRIDNVLEWLKSYFSTINGPDGETVFDTDGTYEGAKTQRLLDGVILDKEHIFNIKVYIDEANKESYTYKVSVPEIVNLKEVSTMAPISQLQKGDPIVKPDFSQIKVQNIIKN